MFVIALAALVVITHDADLIDHTRKPIFKLMHRCGHGLWHLPDTKFDEFTFGQLSAVIEQTNGFHVAYSSNAIKCCQRKQQQGTRPSFLREWPSTIADLCALLRNVRT